MFICPACRTRATAQTYLEDFQHDCPTGTGVKGRQDRLVISGEGANFKGLNNKLQGTTAGIEGERSPPTTDRGFNANLYEDVVREEHIELKNYRGFTANKGK